MSFFRNAMQAHGDPSVMGQPQTWQKFLNDLGTAHEQDMIALRAEISRAAGSVGQGAKGIPLKDLKPEKFESTRKSDQAFKQWAEDVHSWAKRMDPDYTVMLKIAQSLTEWSMVEYKAEMVRQGIDASKHNDIDETFLDAIKKLTKGEARDLVDSAASCGEAWYRLHDRFFSRTVIGATSIATKLAEFKRPNSLNDSYQLLTEIRSLVKEFQRQSPNEPMPTAMIKAAYLKVVPQAYQKGLEMQVDVDRSPIHSIEDKIMTFVRNHSTGPSGMDTSNLQGRIEGQDRQAWFADSWKGSPAPMNSLDGHWWQSDSWNAGEWDATAIGTELDAFIKGKGKGKEGGKGKGKAKGFQGTCYHCHEFGHSQRFCPKNPKGKGKDGGKGKGKDISGKGYWNQGFGGAYYSQPRSKPATYMGSDDAWVTTDAGGNGFVGTGMPCLTLFEKGQEKTPQQEMDFAQTGGWQSPVKSIKTWRRQNASTKTSYESANPFQGLDDGDETHRNVVPDDMALASMKRSGKSLNILEKGTSDLCDFAQKQWVTLPKPLVVDSGAGETVIPAEWLQSHPTKESAGSRSGEYYTTADGSKVYNEGQKEVVISSMDGAQCRSMTFQVAQVHKALGSVSQMVRNGNRLVFDTDANGRDISYIVNKATNEKLYMRQENGVYVLDVLVAPPEYSKQPVSAPTFHRQGS